MKTVIICNSKTGFTKKYADWLAESLKCGTVSYKEFSKAIVEDNDTIIFGSRLFAGKIEGLAKIKPILAEYPKKRFIVFATGATPAEANDTINKFWVDNFTSSEIESIPHFYMQSGLNYEKMKFFDRTLMKTVAKIMSKDKNKVNDKVKANESDSNEHKAYSIDLRQSHDITSKEYIKPLVEYIHGLMK